MKTFNDDRRQAVNFWIKQARTDDGPYSVNQYELNCGSRQCACCRPRRIELASMRGEPGEYRCPVCDSRLEKMSGITYVAYRLTVPESALVNASQALRDLIA